MNRLKKLTYIQYIICGLLVIFILGILLSGHAKNVSFETVQQNIVSCEGINTLKKGTARDMRKNLDLDESLFDWSIYYCGNNQIDLLGHAITKKVGPYYFYAVSEHASTWEEVFMGLVK